MSFNSYSPLARAASLYAFSVLFLLVSLGSYAQQRVDTRNSPYQLRYSQEIPLMGIGTAGSVVSVLLREQRSPLEVGELNELSTDNVLSIDRSAIANYSNGARIASDGLLIVSYAAPLALLAFEEARSDASTLGLMLLETLLLNETLTGMTKALVTRPRPYTYNTELSTELRIDDDNTFSFFSGHTSHSAAAAFFAARVISAYTDQPTVRTIAWAGAIVLPAATGLMRYEAGKHFPTDVVVGYAIGASVGLLIPYLHEVRKNDRSDQRVQIVPHGLGVAVVF